MTLSLNTETVTSLVPTKKHWLCRLSGLLVGIRATYLMLFYITSVYYNVALEADAPLIGVKLTFMNYDFLD